MKKLLLFIMVSLAGCTSSFDGYIVTRAYEICAEHRGVDYLSATAGARCNDGTLWALQSNELKQTN